MPSVFDAHDLANHFRSSSMLPHRAANVLREYCWLLRFFSKKKQRCDGLGTFYLIFTCGCDILEEILTCSDSPPLKSLQLGRLRCMYSGTSEKEEQDATWQVHVWFGRLLLTSSTARGDRV